jgi:hypothetical protein
MSDPIPVWEVEPQRGCYVFGLKPLQISGFRMRARKAGYETVIEKGPKTRTIVHVYAPGDEPPALAEGPHFEVTSDGWVLPG